MKCQPEVKTGSKKSEVKWQPDFHFGGSKKALKTPKMSKKDLKK